MILRYLELCTVIILGRSQIRTFPNKNCAKAKSSVNGGLAMAISAKLILNTMAKGNTKNSSSQSAISTWRICWLDHILIQERLQHAHTHIHHMLYTSTTSDTIIPHALNLDNNTSYLYYRFIKGTFEIYLMAIAWYMKSRQYYAQTCIGLLITECTQLCLFMHGPALMLRVLGTY